MANINERVGKNVKALRKSAGLTQEELSFEAKIDYSYLNEIEAGKRNPSVKRLNSIAKALNVSIRELFK